MNGERGRTEAELRHSEERFSTVFHASPIGIAVSTLAEGRFIDANGAFCTMVGYGPELIGRTTGDLKLWERPADRDEVIARLAEHGAVRGVDLKLRRRDGTLCPVLAFYERVEVGGQVCLLSLVHDLSDRAKLEEQLRQAQKMEAVGRLAGGVAHDFNNLLTVILGYGDFVLNELPAGHPSLAHVESIQHAAQRATELTRQLLAFSRRQILELRTVDLNAIVRGMAPLLHRLIPENIALQTVLKPELDAVCADPGQLEQVIMNLVLNSRDAMPDGGTLTIETDRAQIDHSSIGAHAEARAGDYVVLVVSDTGHGMDEQTQSRLFEPFFTTKASGAGTGLGLATVYGIVRQSEGFIRVYSEPGQGATFKIYLPRTSEKVDVPAPLHVPASLRGSETVLIVEDADPVRALMRESLTRQGYKILEASGGTAALDLLSRLPAELDLLVTDVVMPGLSGRELAEQLKGKYPGLRVLFTSGYTDDAILRQGILQTGITFLQKPFTPETLSRKVRGILDE